MHNQVVITWSDVWALIFIVAAGVVLGAAFIFAVLYGAELILNKIHGGP
jgi:hypothetical protein